MPSAYGSLNQCFISLNELIVYDFATLPVHFHNSCKVSLTPHWQTLFNSIFNKVREADLDLIKTDCRARIMERTHPCGNVECHS